MNSYILPNDTEAEAQLLCCCMIDDGQTLRAAIASGIHPESFFDPAHSILFKTLLLLESQKTESFDSSAVYLALKDSSELQSVGGVSRLSEISGLMATTALSAKLIERTQEFEYRRQLARLGDSLAEHSRNGMSINDLRAELANSPILTDVSSIADRGLRKRLELRRFNFRVPPKEPTPRFYINERQTGTPGNITNLLSQTKTGKTAFAGAHISAAIVGAITLGPIDTLGVTAPSPGDMKLIHLDTEQSPADHDAIIRLCCRRAGVIEPPPWLWSFGCAGFSAAELRSCLRLLLAEASKQGGVFAVLNDGVADFIADVNDARECNIFVAELHSLAIDYFCPILNVIHENPGQDFGKMRGHLGSQLERKAESNIRLKKTDEITVVFSDRMRKAPILESEGPRFKWDNNAAMHLSCESAVSAREQEKRTKVRDIFEAVIDHTGSKAFRYTDILKAIGEVAGVKASRAEDRFNEMKKLGVIRKDLCNLWVKAD